MTVRSRRWYVSLDAVKQELGIDNTTHDAKLKRYIERASGWMERFTGRVFIPVTDTRYFDAPDSPRGALYLNDDLLEVTSISDDQGAIDSSEYFLYPLNGVPKTRIELLHSNKFWYFQDTRQKAITITGKWGYRDDYDDTGATLNGAITSTSVTSLTASDGSLIEVGWSLLVDDEQMFVTNVSSDMVTVQRGNNGTTAATHSDGATIYRYVPPPEVEEMTALLVVTWHKWRNEGSQRRKRVGDFEVVYDSGWPIPQIVMDTVAQLRRPAYG